MSDEELIDAFSCATMAYASLLFGTGVALGSVGLNEFMTARDAAWEALAERFRELRSKIEEQA